MDDILKGCKFSTGAIVAGLVIVSVIIACCLFFSVSVLLMNDPVVQETWATAIAPTPTR